MATRESNAGRITARDRMAAWVLLAVAGAANAAGYFLGYFQKLAWYDDVVHGYTIFALTLVLALYLYGTVVRGATGHGFLVVLVLAAIGLAIGALWEVAEWGYDQFYAPGNAIMGKRDTILDLVWDSLGALAAGVVARGMVKR